MPAPIGSICVFRDDSLTHWKVAVCHDCGVDKEVLGQFSSQGEAEAFAMSEQIRRNNAGLRTPYALHVDDCPCWQKQL
jgi:hypothetical protein